MGLSVDTVLYLFDIGHDPGRFWLLAAIFLDKALYHQGKYVASLIDTSTFTYRIICQKYFFSNLAYPIALSWLGHLARLS